MKKFRCKVCGYIYEGDELPADFVCSRKLLLRVATTA